jgi:hypothetical protein
MNSLLERLEPRERRGSKPRCHLLTHGSPDAVAARLTALVAPFAGVSASDQWMPQGFVDVKEATLPEAGRLLPLDVRDALKRWWLAKAAPTTPNWDIVSTCTIEGRSGILLVEAKAHDIELIKETAGKRAPADSESDNSRRNHLRIGAAIEEANLALQRSTGLDWALSRDSHYQMCNRFAWAWKLTNLGFPVVLVYVGFLGADEMRDKGAPFTDDAAWREVVRQHSNPLFPAEVWGQRWSCDGQSFIPLIRSVKVALQDAELP